MKKRSWRKDFDKISSLVREPTVKNSFFSLGEYFVIPILYLIATPILVKHLGLEEYGIWMFINSVLGLTGIVNFGIGDAILRFVSMYRGRNQMTAVVQVIRFSLLFSLFTSISIGFIVFICAPYFGMALLKISPHLSVPGVDAVRLTGFLMAVRILEIVFWSSLRGCERYDLSVLISVGARGGAILSSVILVQYGIGLIGILLASIATSSVGLLVQGIVLGRIMGASPWIVKWNSALFREMFHFGVYSWLQGIAALIFTQADRLIIGTVLGMSELGIYSVCLQLTQPIQAFVSAAFSVVFPFISRKTEVREERGILKKIRYLIFLNMFVSFCLAFPIVIFGGKILEMWMGSLFPAEAVIPLTLLAVSFFILSSNIAAHYILLGIGEVKFVSITNIIGGAISLLVILIALPFAGLNAAAYGRFFYGAAVSLNYIRLKKVLN